MRDDFDLDRVFGLLDAGHAAGARDLLLQRLSTRPDDPDAHAVLGVCLLRERRLAAAEHEARVALSLDATSYRGFGVLASALISQRKLDLAERTLEAALATHPDADWYHQLMGRIHALRGDRDAELGALRRALELDPEDPGNIAAVGWCMQERGELDEAQRYARDALHIHPGNVAALCLMGQVLLERGELDEARQHALWALRQDPGSARAMALMTAYKARTQFFMGLWWRVMTWLVRKGERGVVLILLGAWLLQTVVVIETEHAGYDQLAEAVGFGWLAIVAGSWIAPSLFRKSLQRELEPVHLDDDF